MATEEDISIALDSGQTAAHTSRTHLARELLLKGRPVIRKLAAWCEKHNKPHNGVKPTLAVVYFDTGDEADEYLYIKRLVAAKVGSPVPLRHHVKAVDRSVEENLRLVQAGVAYAVHKLLPDASLDEVLEKIFALNEDAESHGILIQRPVPEHLCTEQVMASVAPSKHIEEFARGRANNIALDALTRLLDSYCKGWMLDLNILLLGGLNIITPEFKAQLKRRRQCVPSLQDLDLSPAQDDTVIITELNHGHIIKPDMLGPAIKLVVDLGFDPDTKQGDLHPDVLNLDGLLAVPTPGGVLPVLLWTMMERTIRARDRLEYLQMACAPICSIV